MGALSQLLWLDLASNSFTGTFPSSIVNARFLIYFRVPSNAFTGPLPFTDSWQQLQYFEATENSFNGTLNESIGSWSSLTVR